MVWGTPVIAFPRGALTEVVEPRRTGFLVQNVAGMAEAMHRADEIDFGHATPRPRAPRSPSTE